MTRIAVYGAGGVGGYFGARLARAGADVRFLARGAHLRALREHGLRVRSVTGDFQVRRKPPMIRLTSARATSCCSA
jgi:2-dehydropantoate 2-reductase